MAQEILLQVGILWFCGLLWCNKGMFFDVRRRVGFVVF